MLIDCAYFTKGPRHILNATLGTLPNVNSREVNEAIEAYISEYQEEYLVKVLGSERGNKVNAYIVCLNEEPEHTHCEKYDETCNRLKESFADYVFYHILRDSSSQATMTGLVRLKCANEYISPVRRQTGIWNAMVEKHRMFAEWAASPECPLPGISISSYMLEKINHFNI